MTIINTVNCPCGAGKTYCAAHLAARSAKIGEKFFIVQPSHLLIRQTERDLRAIDSSVRITAIYGNDGHSERGVVRRIMDHLRTTKDGGEILLITHAAFERLEFIQRRTTWHVIFDELPNATFFREFTAAENRDIILDCIEPETYNAVYSRLLIHENSAIEEIARNRHRDEFWGVAHDFANKLLNRHWQLFSSTEQFTQFQAEPEEGTPHRLAVFGLLQPSIFEGFASVTLMGACLDESLLFRYWTGMGVAFREHPLIRPRYKNHQNGHLLTVLYATERDWSKRLRDLDVGTAGDPVRLLDAIICRVLDHMAGRPFVWVGNNDVKDNPFGDAIRLPNISHGLNAYSKIDNAVILSALNPPPVYFEFVAQIAHINPTEVKTAIYRQAAYQAACRTSLRDMNSSRPKSVIVMDRATAEWLADQFPGAQIAKLPGSDLAPFDGRKSRKAAKSNGQRAAEFRNRRRQDLLDGLCRVNQIGSNINPSILIRIPVTPNLAHVGSFFADKYAKRALFESNGITTDGLVALLREQHERVFVRKEDNLLICAGQYDPDLAPDTDRGLANIVSASGVLLDNDGGDLSHKEFAAMFPDLRIVVFNSYSSTPQEERYRVFIPTTHLMTIEAHKEIIAQIRHRLVKRGFYGDQYLRKHPEKASKVKRHGFDEGKFNVASLFYLPCQAASGPDASFFIEYNPSGLALNPFMWIDRTILDHRPAPEPESITRTAEPVSIQRKDPKLTRALTLIEAEKSEHRQANYEERVESAITRWRCHIKGTGNSEFFVLAVSLANAGMSRLEIQTTLYSESYHAHGPESQRDRKAAIPAIMDRLRGAA